MLQLFPGKDDTYAVPFTRVVYIEADDFREEDPGKKYYGLAPGKSVLLRSAALAQVCEYAGACSRRHNKPETAGDAHVLPHWTVAKLCCCL